MFVCIETKLFNLYSTIKKVGPMLYSLGKIRYCITNDTVVLIYKTYIVPVLGVGNYTLDGYKRNQIKKLQKVQNRALRLCYKTEFNNSAYDLHIRANLLSLKCRKHANILRIINSKLIKCDNTFIFISKDNRTQF